jgi:hypothetical protein
MSDKDQQARFHRDWLGLAQPIEGLVFSVPVLADAQIMPQAGAELSARFRQALVSSDDDAAGHFGDLRAFFETFLGYRKPAMLVARDALPTELHFYAQEGRQDIRPSFAIARGPFDDAQVDPFGDVSAPPIAASSGNPFVALVWDVRDDAGDAGLSLDKPEDVTGPWRYPPTAKFERLLRHTGVPVGLLCNGVDLRLVYAPAGETTSHLTFRSADMQSPAARPLLAAFELLLSAQRTYQAGEAFTLEGLLRESRRRQADVTKDLAAQVFEAVELLLEGFEQASARDRGGDDWLRAAIEAPDDHLYQGVLSVVLRLVFLLYAEDQGLLPTDNATYARHMSVQGLYDDLVEDAGMHPESMHHRFGAYGRLLALFRALYLGVEHGELRLPPRRGKLFDPSCYPFLEGGMPESTAAIVSPEARAAVRIPSIDDGTIHAVLHRLVVFEGQRLSYRALDVEQIGSVYESLMGYHVLRVESSAVRIGSNRTWIETANITALDETGLSKAQIKVLGDALKDAGGDCDAIAAALSRYTPGGAKDRERHQVAAARLVLQPGPERRRSGSHYTPRSLTEGVVHKTLAPLLACLGAEPTVDQILQLKICDPAMGSGAFLVAACRELADAVVKAWTRSGELAALSEAHGDAHLHARRLVAQRCLYGVDKNAAAVELAKLSLWLETLSKDLPFTFLDHALRHGDSLVGLSLDQIRSFHWAPKKQLESCERALKDALDQAVSMRSEILELALKDDIGSQEEKRRLLDHSRQAIDDIRMIADVCVGAFFAEQKDKARETERSRRLALVERHLNGEASVRPELQDLAQQARKHLSPFHWMIEFPEVFFEQRPDPLDEGKINGAAFMEAIVGNPPFKAQNQLAGELGGEYRDWLFGCYEEIRGKCDLVAQFFQRSAQLIGRHGTIGLIATKTIAEGDTRESGLAVLLRNGLVIYDAQPRFEWPGEADVAVSTVHLAKGRPAQPPLEIRLAQVAVDEIDSSLRHSQHRAVLATLRALG